MEILKKIISGLGTFAAIVFVVVLLLILSPIILGALLFFATVSLYTRLWAWLRRDPKRDLGIEGLLSDEWPEAETKEKFINEFKKLTDIIAEMSGAEKGEVEYEGFSIFDEPHKKIKWTELGLSQKLSTKHAEVIISFGFGAYYCDQRERIIVGTEDGDDQCGAGFPPATVSVTKPKLHIERNFPITTYEDVWMVIGILRGKEKFSQKEGQLWSYIPEHKAWLVQYKVNKSDYGLRNEFKGKSAHKYARDD